MRKISLDYEGKYTDHSYRPTALLYKILNNNNTFYCPRKKIENTLTVKIIEA
jgi:hypothetical protein